MKKSLITVLFIIGFNLTTKAQEKIVVGILPITYVQGAASSQDANSIYETVTNAFVKTKRFNIVDRSKMESLKKERELQKTEDFMESKNLVEQGGLLSVNFFISGHVISASPEQMRADDGTITYKTKLSISLKVIDVATGQVISTETIEPKSGSSLMGVLGVGTTSAQSSMAKAIKGIEDKVDEFVKKNFPQMFSIAEIQEKDGKGNATKILIAGGSEFGLKKGDKLKVVEIIEMDVNGKKISRKKEVGELKITKVEDENFSICSVSSGGIDINAKFEAKANLQIITKD